MAQQFEGKVEVIGVASRDEVPAMEEFVDRHELDQVRHIADVDGEVWQQFGVVAQPAWVFIDGQSGRPERVLGAIPRGELEDRLESLAG